MPVGNATLFNLNSFYTATIYQWKPLIKHSSALFYEKGVKEFDFLYDYRDWSE